MIVKTFYRIAMVTFSLVTISAFSQAQNISTVAGNGTLGYGGDNGIATSASLQLPRAVAVDPFGNVYVSDFINHRIRKINASDGKIVTVAGTGTGGYNGDGIAATTATIKSPAGITTDASGNVYFVDQYNNRVRKITVSSGLISTVAGNGTRGFSGDGGLATSAKLNIPYGIALDASNNIYIADAGNNAIRKVSAADGKISMIAGSDTVPSFTGDGGAALTARLNYPTGIALDASGNIYFTDYNNHRVRKITVSSGIINTVVGNAGGCTNMDGVDAATASLYNPNSIAIDAAGNLYIADIFNYRIRKMTISDNKINTFGGNGIAGFSGDGGVPTGASLFNPGGVALDANGNLYIADTYNNRIRRIGIFVVPVKWLSFTAANDNGMALLKWETAQETTTKMYRVQYSINGTDWMQVGEVAKADGNGNKYAFRFTHPAKGVTYYRIEQVDVDGRSGYSDVRSITIKVTAANSAIVYPLPLHSGSFTLDLREPLGQPLEYMITSANGKTVATGIIRNSVQQLSMPETASGIYFLKLGNGQVLKLFR